jgi:hypothetical protein
VAWELWGVCSCISKTGEIFRADAVVCCAVRHVVINDVRITLMTVTCYTAVISVLHC